MTRVAALAVGIAIATAGGDAWASQSQCPASAPFDQTYWAPPWVVPASGDGGQTIGLAAERDRHYKRMTLEFDMEIDGFDAGSEYVPIVWVRNGNAGDQTYEWTLMRNISQQTIISIQEIDILDYNEPATWSPGTYHFVIDMDAEAGMLTLEATDSSGGQNTLTREFPASIVPMGNQGLRLIWGWHEINLDIVYPPWGWTFSNLSVHMEPGGPIGPEAVECPGGLDWVTPSLPDGELDVAYGPVTLEAMAGTGTYSFAAEPASTLPSGLAVDAGGTLQGTPTEAGDFEVTIRVTDTNAEYIDRTFALHIEGGAAGDSSSTGGDGGSGNTNSDPSAGEAGGGPSGATASGSADSDTMPAAETDEPLPGGFGHRDNDNGCSCRSRTPPSIAFLVFVLLLRRRRVTR